MSSVFNDTGKYNHDNFKGMVSPTCHPERFSELKWHQALPEVFISTITIIINITTIIIIIIINTLNLSGQELAPIIANGQLVPLVSFF